MLLRILDVAQNKFPSDNDREILRLLASAKLWRSKALWMTIKKEDIPLVCPAEPRGLGAKDDIEGDWLKQLAVSTPSPLERVGLASP